LFKKRVKEVEEYDVKKQNFFGIVALMG